jgi:NAD-dependent SIR2 family protein deacetylase
MERTKTVFILGAGASADAGIPLMSNFLDDADDLWKTGRVNSVAKSFELVQKARSRLQAVHSKSVLDTRNIEHVFAAFEMAEMLNKFPGLSARDRKALSSAMRDVIVHTVEKTMTLRTNSVAPVTYPKFWQLLTHLIEDVNPRHEISVITFNYDLAFEYTVFRNRASQSDSESKPHVEYGFKKAQSQIPSCVRLYKLHGSLNWGWCETCKQIIPWALEDYLESHPLVEGDYGFMLEVGSDIKTVPHRLGHVVQQNPLIIPPVATKIQHCQQLAGMWRNAASALEKAENIVVIGYSLPPSDHFFHTLYALGTAGSTVLRKLWVFNPDPKDAPNGVNIRFSGLLGPSATNVYRYFSTKFDEAIPPSGNKRNFDFFWNPEYQEQSSEQKQAARLR